MANKENQEMNNLNREDEFIQEKIKSKRRKNILKMIFTIVFVMICGLVFGFAVRMAMIFTDGKLKDLLGAAERTPTPSAIPSPTAMVSVNTPDPTEPVISSVPVPISPTPVATVATPGPTLAPIEGEIEIGVVDPVAPHPEFSYSDFYKEIVALTEAVRPQVADITAAKTVVDWFGNVSLSNSQTSGLILANNGQQLLILADYNVLAGSDAISVKVLGKDTAAAIYSYDEDYGLAVLAVDFSLFSEEERENIKYAKLYPDDNIATGRPVVAIGNANGYAGSIAFGIISGVGYKTYVTDGMVKYFTTDWNDYKNSGAFIYDMTGAVCGMITHSFKRDPNDGITTCISLEALKEVITTLVNGRALKSLGLGLSDMPVGTMDKMGLAQGIYIKDVKPGSSAAKVGLKPGDVITAINDNAVTTSSELTMYLAGYLEKDYLIIDFRRSDEDSLMDHRLLISPDLKNIQTEKKGKQ